MYWEYKKVDGANLKRCPTCDQTGEITGRIIFGLPTWFDEHPEERKALGWIKHIHPDVPEYDKQTQFVITGTKQIDEYTIEDYYIVREKSEEMMVAEELAIYDDTTFFLRGHWYEQV